MAFAFKRPTGRYRVTDGPTDRPTDPPTGKRPALSARPLQTGQVGGPNQAGCGLPSRDEVQLLRLLQQHGVPGLSFIYGFRAYRKGSLPRLIRTIGDHRGDYILGVGTIGAY